MIVVTGASGHLGRLVIDALASTVEPAQIVAGVRSPAKAADLAERGVTVRTLDYDRPDTIRTALVDAERVLLISSSEIGQRVPQHRAVIDAATAAGVRQLAYTSVLRANTSPLLLAQEHVATEQAVRTSGLTFTILRNSWYIENYTENLGPALDHGAIVGAAGTGRIAAAARADFAQAAATVLGTDGHEGATYELAGTAFTMAELAAAVSAVVGQTIAYTDLPATAYRDVLIGSGLPAPIADLLVDTDLGVAAGALDGAPTDLERLIGRPSTPIAEAIAAALPAPVG